MKTFILLSICAVTLSACAISGNDTAFFDNGNDVSFLRQGSSSCPGIADSNNPIYERYPLRCGPQAQANP